jgi:hypothetical protein
VNKDTRVLSSGPGVLAAFLLLLPPVLGAEDAVKDGAANAEEGAAVQEQVAPQAPTKDEQRQKLLMAKYDANRDGRLDAEEKKRLDSDLAIWAKKYQQALAKYDANKNGVLDPEEAKTMKKDEALADRNERKVWSDLTEIQRKSQQRLKQPAARDLGRLPLPPSRP